MNWLYGLVIAALAGVLAALGWTALEERRYRQDEREYYLSLAERHRQVLEACSGPLSPVPAPWGSAPWEGEWQPSGPRHRKPSGAHAR